MKIISKFKDYYDGIVNSVGIDSNIIFERYETHEKEFIIKYLYTPTYEDKSNYYNNKTNWERMFYSFSLVGFCGKIYPVLQINTYYTTYGPNKDTVEYIYDIEKIKQTYLNCFDQKNTYTAHNHNWDKFISQTNNKQLLNIFLDKKVISFHIHKTGNLSWVEGAYTIGSVTYNNILKDIHFFKLVDAFTAFNEISIFVAEQLNTEINEFNMSDKQMVVSKGFDPVYGFRKRKK